MAKPDPTTVSIDAFERLVGATPGELASLLKSGTLKRAAPGRLPLIEAVRAYIVHMKSTARDASLTAAQADARAARAEASELSLAVQMRDLVPDEEVEAALQHVCGTILETLGGLAVRVSRDRADRSGIEDVLRFAQMALSDELFGLASVDRLERRVL